MPVKPVVIGIAVVALAFAIWLIIGGIRRHRWRSLLRIPPILCCLILVAFLVPTIFGLDVPHPYFNKPAPVSSGAVLFFRVNPSSQSNLSILVAVSAQTGKTLWQRPLQGSSSSFIGDGRDVYTTDTAELVTTSTNTVETTTTLAARDGMDGTLLWQTSLPNTSVTTTPVVADGVLYIEAVHPTPQKPVQLLAIRASDGGTLWAIPIDDALASSLSIHPEAGILYLFASGNSTLEARRPDNGELLWTQTVSGESIIVEPSAIFAYTYSAYGGITAWSAQNRAMLWTFGKNDFIHSAAFLGDTLYVSEQHSGNDIDANGKLINPETVYALDAATGAVRWKFATQSRNSGSISAGAGAAYIKADDGIYALRAGDGAVLWHSDAHNNWTFTDNSPVLGTVLYVTAIQILPPDNITITFFGSSKGQEYLYAVNTVDGSTYWGATVGPVITIYPRIVL